MLKARIISGCKYTYDDKLLLVIIGSLLPEPGKTCYYDNGLFRQSLECVSTYKGVCRLKIVSMLTKFCPRGVYYHKDDISQKESGIYEGKRLVYKVGSLHFKYLYHFGHIKPIDDEINFMLDCGVEHVQSLMEVLLRKNHVRKIHLVKTTKGLPRCHYPLLHNNVEHDLWEMEYWQGRHRILIDTVEMPRYYDN